MAAEGERRGPAAGGRRKAVAGERRPLSSARHVCHTCPPRRRRRCPARSAQQSRVASDYCIGPCSARRGGRREISGFYVKWRKGRWCQHLGSLLKAEHLTHGLGSCPVTRTLWQESFGDTLAGTGAPGPAHLGVFEDCCLAYHRRIRGAVLRHAWGYQRQEVTGSCNLPAVIFHFRQKNKMVCGDPKNKEVQRAMRFLDTRKKTPTKLRHTWMTFRGFHAGKNLSPGTSELPSSKLSDPTRHGKRNTSSFQQQQI
nr:C-C motif chemokine 25 isoform X1 [Microcebus murinus]XP_012646245.1 C-C motif chemokine 25 isoform X1 [Microcebus murinus]